MGSVRELMAAIKDSGASLDEVILERMRELGRQAYQTVAEALDEWLFRHRPGGLRVVHRRAVWHKTVLGRVRVMRRHYRDKRGGYRYLLDELLGMRRYFKTTAKVVELVAGLVVQMPFRRSAEVLRRTAALDLSAQCLVNLLERVAAPHIEEAEAQVQQFLETGALPEGQGRRVAQVMVEADGVYLSLQRERQRKAEVKTVIGYEGWREEGQGRYCTVNKFRYADVAATDQCWAAVSLKLHERYGGGGMDRLIVGGDGASWIREGAGYLGGTFQLDRYHLNREITLALGRDRATAAAVSQACRRGGLDTALLKLAEVRATMRGEPARRVDRLCRYLREHEAGLRDYRLDLSEDSRALRGTGAIEGNVDKMVVKRMKNQGMSWTIRGIRRMLVARLLWLEGKPGLLSLHPAGRRSPAVPIKKVQAMVSRAVTKGIDDDWLQVTLPALRGPHANRPWAINLRSLARASG